MISALLLMALARCASVFAGCDCGASWAVVGEITLAPDGGTIVEGSRFGSVPDVVPVAGAAGTQVLITDWGRPFIVASDGTISCAGVTVDALTYAPTIVDGTCAAGLRAAGLKQPPCNDTGPFPLVGCACSSPTGPLLAALALLMLRRAQRSQP